MLVFVVMGKVVLNCFSLLSNELLSCTGLGGLLLLWGGCLGRSTPCPPCTPCPGLSLGEERTEESAGLEMPRAGMQVSFW